MAVSGGYIDICSDAAICRKSVHGRAFRTIQSKISECGACQKETGRLEILTWDHDGCK